MGNNLQVSGQGPRGGTGSTVEFMLLLPGPCPLHLPAGFLAMYTCQPVIRHFQRNFLFLWASVSQSEVFLLPVSTPASAGSVSKMQGPRPQARPTVSEYFVDGAPKPACLTRSPGHSHIPQGLRTIKAVEPQNRHTLSLLEWMRSGISEEGSLEFIQ